MGGGGGELGKGGVLKIMVVSQQDLLDPPIRLFRILMTHH